MERFTGFNGDGKLDLAVPILNDDPPYSDGSS